VRVITLDALAELYRGHRPPRHDTLALHELHTLGPDGWPAEHQTIQVIKSTVDRLETYPYRFDTDQLVFEVVRGGRVGDTYRVTDSFFGVDIVLDRALAARRHRADALPDHVRVPDRAGPGVPPRRHRHHARRHPVGALPPGPVAGRGSGAGGGTGSTTPMWSRRN
jgi:hypothetical protein